MQPGWYYAQGDAPGTQRYWDGTQWVGGPQPVGQPQDVGSYGGVGGAAAVGGSVEFGPRAVAWLIDVVPFFVASFIGYFLLLVGDAASILGLLIMLGAVGFLVWNKGVRMGTTGQSIGKANQNIKLVNGNSGEPIGAGMGIVRLLLSFLFYWFCGIPYIVDHLWPLWDADKQRLLDKILTTRVVNA